MPLNRLFVAGLCALLVSGAILGTTPSCGRTAATQELACCRNEATCPMHQKQDSGVPDLETCHHDGTDASAAVIAHRAVLTAGLSTMVVPQRERMFDILVQFPPSVSPAPLTPPPRRG